MILQALVAHYEDLVRLGRAFRPGWSPAKISYALCIDETGVLREVVSLREEQVKGKKTVLVPREMKVPTPVKKASGIISNFLCENSSYLLGVDSKGKPQRALECFAACRALHEQLLEGVDSAVAQAVLAFFRTWDPATAAGHPALADFWDDIINGANLVFRINGTYAQEDPAIQTAWQQHYDTVDDRVSMPCLVTGTVGPVALLHPSIKGIPGAQSSGASLVSFNAPAFCSYGHTGEQGMNAPTSPYAAFAYGAALNHLISDREHVFRIGDTTVLFWADGGEDAYQNVFSSFCFGAQSQYYTEQELRSTVKHLLAGRSVQLDQALLDPNRNFYLLGLSPNAARLSVRFFLRNSFGTLLRSVEAHYQRLSITGLDENRRSLWWLLNETVNQNASDKSPSPNLAGEMLRSILNDTRYPATLLNGVILRIRAEHRITPGRAAILKAYYLKNPNKDVPKKEVLTVSLNPESTSVPYNLGRLFSILEAIQSAANPGINATIKDKYFNSASATPAVVFPTLVNLAQKHLRKLGGGLAVVYDKQLTQVLSLLGESYPARLNLPQQGSFQLGYYHQTQARYQSKSEK